MDSFGIGTSSAMKYCSSRREKGARTIVFSIVIDAG